MPEEKQEEKKEEVVPGQIEVHPSAFTYVVEVNGERVSTENPETAVIFSMLEKIYKKLEEKK
jgi:hypothetical protein